MQPPENLDAHALIGTIDRLEEIAGKISEVSSATEVAATDIPDGLSRIVELVDRAFGDHGPASGDRDDTPCTVREELYGVMVYLQFQDITSQQLSHVATLLAEMRQGMTELVRIFAPYMSAEALSVVPSEPAGAFDPNATTADATDRQAIADALFSSRVTRA